ncbi:MAG: transposase [Candidatus Methylumidiphilus sp.]
MLPGVALMVLGSFAPLFTRPVRGHAQALAAGAILCQGARTVAGVLRALGLAGELGFCKYHRVLSRARWSGLQGAKILLGLLVAVLASQGYPLIILVDETVERRKGKRIKAKGRHRDAVRSTQSEVVKCWGLKWICLTLRVPLPWSPRPWALPFLTLLAPPARADEKAGRRHKATVDWTAQAVGQVSRRLASAAFTVVGDGAYASVALARACRGRGAALVSRLRLDARLFGFPEAPAPGRRGRWPKKGARLPSLKQRLEDPAQPWRDAEVAWYGGVRKPVRLLSGVCLWHTPGQDPVRLRWVLVADPAGEKRPQAFFATDDGLTPERIVELFVLRWNVEVTFEEARRHLGVETQRQWSDLAIARTTPALMGLFSLVCLMALRWVGEGAMPVRQAAWYAKKDATFSDVLAFVRRAIWAGKYFVNSETGGDRLELSRRDLDALLDQLAAVA